ncbi:hypothetical protein ACOMHN_014456 [Nucella lapillus]
MESGGIRKYLYAGNKKEAEEEQPTFSPKAADSKPYLPVDLDSVWSIQRNVRPLFTSAAPQSQDGLNHNINKGYYSRHGAMKGEPGDSDPHRGSSRTSRGPAGPLDDGDC